MLIDLLRSSLRGAPFFLTVFISLSVSASDRLSDYLNGDVEPTGAISATYALEFDALAERVLLDKDGNGSISKNELKNNAPVIGVYIKTSLAASRAGKACSFTILSDWSFKEIAGANYLLVPVVFGCLPEGDFKLVYVGVDESHHELEVLIRDQGRVNSSILSFSNNFMVFKTSHHQMDVFVDFLDKGFFHILSGYDHIVFLITLLLGAVLIRQKGYWTAIPNVSSIFREALWIVTSFTLAHSLTLTASMLGWIYAPSHWVEVGIALTVAVAAINNIAPFLSNSKLLVFCFGLVHGMGFAGALSELGLDHEQKLLSLFSFNLGVEFGQLLILGITLPLFIFLRRYAWYPKFVLTGASVVISMLAVGWAVNRL